MPYAVEMFFEGQSTAAVREAWRRLAESHATPYMLDSGSRPHVTLAVFEEVRENALHEALAHFAARLPAFPLVLSRVGVFESTGVIYVAAEPWTVLESVHRLFWSQCARIGSGAWEHYLPGNWTPHCTLAVDVAMRDADDAVRAANDALVLPIGARVESIAWVRFRPVEHLLVLGLPPCS